MIRLFLPGLKVPRLWFIGHIAKIGTVPRNTQSTGATGFGGVAIYHKAAKVGLEPTTNPVSETGGSTGFAFLAMVFSKYCLIHLGAIQVIKTSVRGLDVVIHQCIVLLGGEVSSSHSFQHGSSKDDVGCHQDSAGSLEVSKLS